ncbi:MAG TPA: limonene-1,2-epoxide hydrolase family protein [Candidatus Binataceae bacterium]|nr:limonene-1,2-epoxide hydrolase family protein [Candidatus Binataceae bacterium]
MSADNERVVSDFCRVWSALNIDKVMEFFADDAVYHNMMLDPARGKAAIRKTIDGFMPGTTKVEFKILTTASAGNLIFNERVDSFVVNGRPIAVPVAGVFELAEGKIKAWRDYFDLATYMKQRDGK